MNDTEIPFFQRSWWIDRHCAVCHTKSIGINFGVPTCAPCKAFFRRNARRKELLQAPCQFRDFDFLSSANSSTSSSSSSSSSLTNFSNSCQQIRHCTSCRLRRCFHVGMREELVRTDEERQRVRQLIETNRRRKTENYQIDEGKTSLTILCRITKQNDEYLQENDWILLSNIVQAYDNYCLKFYTERRHLLTIDEIETFSKLKYHAASILNQISSFLSFLNSMPIIQNLDHDDRIYLCKHNIRPLIFPHRHELEQTCFSESWEAKINNLSTEFICGPLLYFEYVNIKNEASSTLITDPVVTRLWLLILFFSTPLYCYFDLSLPKISIERQKSLNYVQNSYVSLLWNYLLQRHGFSESMRIFVNLIRIYLRMQRLAQAVNIGVRTRTDLTSLNESLNSAILFDHDRL